MRNLIDILKLAVPLVFIQLCQTSLGLGDTLVAGRYDHHDLAAIFLLASHALLAVCFVHGALFVPAMCCAGTCRQQQSAA